MFWRSRYGSLLFFTSSKRFSIQALPVVPYLAVKHKAVVEADTDSSSENKLKEQALFVDILGPPLTFIQGLRTTFAREGSTYPTKNKIPSWKKYLEFDLHKYS